jgi:hypothetical protein
MSSEVWWALGGVLVGQLLACAVVVAWHKLRP